jgi:hypothetical protein
MRSWFARAGVFARKQDSKHGSADLLTGVSVGVVGIFRYVVWDPAEQAGSLESLTP